MVRRVGGQCGSLASVEGVVVETLGDEDEVCDAEVDCEGDDCWDETGPYGACGCVRTDIR